MRASVFISKTKKLLLRILKTENDFVGVSQINLRALQFNGSGVFMECCYLVHHYQCKLNETCHDNNATH